MIGRVVGAALAVLGCVLLASCVRDPGEPEPTAVPPATVAPTADREPEEVRPATAPTPEREPDGVPEGVPLERALADFFGPSLTVRDRGSFGLADRAHVLPSDDPRFRDILRVRFPAGSSSPKSAREDGTPKGGAQLYLLFADGPADAIRLTYHVRFPDGFAFVKGGKLPGLFGGTRTSGGRIPDGSDGLSTRYMWRRAGAGEVYAYLPTSRDHGTSLGRGAWTFPTGRWVRLEQEVRLNTPGGADGSITVWIDGREVLREDGLTFRTTGELRIDGVFFSAFFGGDDASWSSPSDQHIDFAGFETAPVDGS